MESWPLDVVLAQSKAHNGTRFVLALIAGHWNPATGVAFPGNRRLAALAGCSTSTVARRIRALLDLGELEIAERGGGHRSARFRLPALDYPVLAIDSGGSLGPLAGDPGRIANGSRSLAIPSDRIATARGEDVQRSASDPITPSSDPLAIRPDPIGSRREVEELHAYARACAREGPGSSSTTSPRSDSDVSDEPYESAHGPEIGETFADLRDRLGFRRKGST